MLAGPNSLLLTTHSGPRGADVPRGSLSERPGVWRIRPARYPSRPTSRAQISRRREGITKPGDGIRSESGSLKPRNPSIIVAPCPGRVSREERATAPLVHGLGDGRGDLPPARSGGVIRPGPAAVGGERDREHGPILEALELGTSSPSRGLTAARPGPGLHHLRQGPHHRIPPRAGWILLLTPPEDRWFFLRCYRNPISLIAIACTYQTP